MLLMSCLILQGSLISNLKICNAGWRTPINFYIHDSIQYLIRKSINQSNFCSTNIPGKARLSGATAQSVFDSKIEETVP